LTCALLGKILTRGRASPSFGRTFNFGQCSTASLGVRSEIKEERWGEKCRAPPRGSSLEPSEAVETAVHCGSSHLILQSRTLIAGIRDCFPFTSHCTLGCLLLRSTVVKYYLSHGRKIERNGFCFAEFGHTCRRQLRTVVNGTLDSLANTMPSMCEAMSNNGRW
jgi:hypothetical protein